MDEIRYISRFEDEYPDNLRFIPDPPAGIYIRGELPDPEKKTVSIVGARACSEYGRYMAEYFASHLAAAGVQIVSGMARGIDGIAQKAALDAGGKTFGILGFGPDVIYPKENKELFERISGHGGLISEYPEGSKPLRAYFAERNRLISGICDILLVIEARIRSGTSITVHNALEQGRDIFAIPGRLTDGLSAGCNKLISEGAGIALCPDDILKALGLLSEEPTITSGGRSSDEACMGYGVRHISLNDKEKMVYGCLDLYPKSVDEIVRTLHIPVGSAVEILTSLCIKGAARECAKSNYQKVL